MPFALDDLDSNFLHNLVMITSYAHGSATFVSMFGEDCMLGEGVEGVGEMALQQQRSQHAKDRFCCLRYDKY